MKVSGSCLCGGVSFVVEGEFDSLYFCHCKRCQKDTGSAHASNLFSSTATLRWTTGEDKVNSYQLPATRHMKSFCSTCGSVLPAVQMDEQLLVVPAGSLDQAISIKPTAHIFTANSATWANEIDDVVAYDYLPP